MKYLKLSFEINTVSYYYPIYNELCFEVTLFKSTHIHRNARVPTGIYPYKRTYEANASAFSSSVAFWTTPISKNIDF